MVHPEIRPELKGGVEKEGKVKLFLCIDRTIVPWPPMTSPTATTPSASNELQHALQYFPSPPPSNIDYHQQLQQQQYMQAAAPAQLGDLHYLGNHRPLIAGSPHDVQLSPSGHFSYQHSFLRFQ